MNLLVRFVLFATPFFAFAAFAVEQPPASEMVRLWDLQPNFSDTNISVLPNDSEFEDQIPLTLVILKDSGWTFNMVMEKLNRTIDIYSQCKIGFSPITVVETKNSNGTTVNRDYPYPFFTDENLTEIAFNKPIVYFVDRELMDRNYGGYAWRASSRGGRSSKEKSGSMFLYLSWATTADRSTNLEETRPGYYEVMAHELGHILLDQSHHGSNHIMAGMDSRSNIINTSQCDRIRSINNL